MTQATVTQTPWWTPWRSWLGTGVAAALGALLAMRFGGALCEADWDTVHQFYETSASWPPVVLIVVIFLAAKFDRNVRGLVDRLRTVKWGDKEALLAETEQQLAPAAPMLPTNPDAEPQGAVAQAAPGAAVVPQAPPNRAVDPEVLPILPPEANVEVWLDYILANPGPVFGTLMMTSFRANAERFFNFIYGSQVMALEYLAAQAGPRPMADLVPFFNKHVELGGKPDAFAPWLNFLQMQQLIRIVDVPNERQYQITSIGERFLGYIKLHFPHSWNAKPL
jgi:hypothetical protein